MFTPTDVHVVMCCFRGEYSTEEMLQLEPSLSATDLKRSFKRLKKHEMIEEQPRRQQGMQLTRQGEAWVFDYLTGFRN